MLLHNKTHTGLTSVWELLTWVSLPDTKNIFVEYERSKSADGREKKKKAVHDHVVFLRGKRGW